MNQNSLTTYANYAGSLFKNVHILQQNTIYASIYASHQAKKVHKGLSHCHAEQMTTA